MFARVYIMRGGLRHWMPGGYVVTPEGAFVGPEPEQRAEIWLIDDDAYSGQTLLRAARALRRRGYTVHLAASPAPGMSLPEWVHPLPVPVPSAPMIAVCGMPGAGKSAVAHGLAGAIGARYLKWARFVTECADPGRYGEKAAELEARDPLVFARSAWSAVQKDPARPVVLDGVKDWRAITFLSFATRRPLIPLWVEAPERMRQITLAWRRDSDDFEDDMRRRLFGDRWSEIRAQSFVVDLAADDHSEALEALAWHGLRIPLRVGNSLLDKRAAVEIAAHNACKAGPPMPAPFPRSMIRHTSYSDKLGLQGEVAARVNAVASAFRIIDDMLDGHEERRFRRADGSAEVAPALWREQSPWMAVYWASLILAWAGRAAQDDGYAEMIQAVRKATLVELEAELAGRPMTQDEYEASMDKEVAFRRWIAGLTGGDPDAAARDAVRAQRKNDLLSQGLERQRLADVI